MSSSNTTQALLSELVKGAEVLALAEGMYTPDTLTVALRHLGIDLVVYSYYQGLE